MQLRPVISEVNEQSTMKEWQLEINAIRNYSVLNNT